MADEAGPITWQKGEKQPNSCKDAPFALLYIGHLAAIAGVAATYGKTALNESLNENANANANADTEEYNGYIYAVVATGVIALIVSTLAIVVMIPAASILIKASLIFSVALMGLFTVASFAAGSFGMGIFFAIFFAISICYAKLVWPRIPFATANLRTALYAVKSNFGVTFVGYIMQIVAFGLTILWSLAFYGVQAETITCVQVQGADTCEDTVNYGYLFLSLYWSAQVVKNVMHVTVSGTVGTWWFSPEEASFCCSPAIGGSFFRATTYSFGSICMGSLIVAFIQALRALAEQARQNDDGNGILICIADCILSIIQGIVEYFNQWAYVYVGIYGYKYLEAGKAVIQLFKTRGWDVIIADDLVGNVFFLVALCIGGITALLSRYVLGTTTDWIVDPNASSYYMWGGFFIGLMVSVVSLSVVDSAVNAVIVLFAEAPGEFQDHYPELSTKMREAYMSAYPDLM
eukprot:CAMPEP_0178964126 /NCGR_PEP_ID=MMETSP0789-20121207/15468_1 /TAXON_ID=3005 /ORGANISM="Rhizosolenia setigera, Strain CCMP 1694" /LENGTH=461 /DNA_ID=CAMNT_0020648795 /DNA_START=17 /DNA_END=1402 /DNA_ORIENTATION=-